MHGTIHTDMRNAFCAALAYRNRQKSTAMIKVNLDGSTPKDAPVVRRLIDSCFDDELKALATRNPKAVSASRRKDR